MKAIKTALLVALVSILALSFALAIACGDDDDDEGAGYYDPDVSDDDDDDDAAYDDDTGDDDDDDADDDADDDFDDDVDDDDSNEFSCQGDVCIDSASGIMWQNEDRDDRTGWEESKDYCANLDAGEGYGGFKGWRLPTISELRTLIRGCPATEPGGECGVTDDCLDKGACWSELCRSCEPNVGPGPEGRYWPADLEGIAWLYWSSSEQTDSGGDNAWAVGFNCGSVHGLGISGTVNYGTRCVRTLD
jgi:Protein of unknown function (DUF1566)